MSMVEMLCCMPVCTCNHKICRREGGGGGGGVGTDCVEPKKGAHKNEVDNGSSEDVHLNIPIYN